MPLPNVQLYSDWWANPNPGPWGYGVILSCWNITKEFSQWFIETTNNRMELLWAITGLKKLTKRSKVEVYTDSQYTINGIEKWWAQKWKENNWYRTKSQKAVNHDLWAELLDLVEKHEVSFHWVKWHSGHEQNERCDELATLALEGDDLVEDTWYTPLEDNSISLPFLKEWSGQWEKESGKQTTHSSTWGAQTDQKCKKCGWMLLKKQPKHTKKTLQKAYFYEYYYTCSSCGTNFMPEEAKRDISHLKI